jgi:Holliday junction resolvase
MSNLSRRKGARVENEIVHKLNHHGIPARKISRIYQSGHDLDAVVRGRPLRVEVKSRAQGFGTIYNWLSDRDVLIVKADRQEPLDIAAEAPPTWSEAIRGPPAGYSAGRRRLPYCTKSRY